MKYLIPVAVIATLVSGCESRRTICADFAGGRINEQQARKKLGIPDRRFVIDDIRGMCDYYK